MGLLSAFTVSASVVAGLAVSATPATAHPGGLNLEGCHNHRNTGGYHCHRGSGTAAEARTYGAVPGGRPYRNCSEAKAAGAAPVYRGESGYGAHLDRDNDGIGCEPYRR